MAFTEALKLQVRERADFRCCRCREIGVQIHHIVPQADGGPDTEDNAAPLCPNCHTWFGGNPEKRKEIRQMRDSWYKRIKARYAGPPDEMARKLDAILDEVRSQPADPEPEAPPSEGLDHSRMRQAVDALTQDELHVLRAPLSDSRTAALRTGIESDRESSGVRKLFQAVEAYERRNEYRSDARFGNRRNIFKGPFVDGSSWVEYRSDDFSRAPEGYLLFKLGHLLQSNLGAARASRSWEDAVRFIDEAAQEIERADGRIDLLIVQGEIDQPLEMEMLRHADWTTTPSVRGVDLSEVGSIGELIRGLPVLQIYDQRLLPSLHVVDLSDFRYVQTNPDAMSDDDLLFRVETINWELAAETIDANPELAASLYRAKHHEEGRYSREEAVVRLQLLVRFHLIEGGFIEEQRVALSRSLALPARTHED